MENKKMKQVIFITAAGIFAAAAVIIAVTYLQVTRVQNSVLTEPGIQQPGPARQAEILPNPGGTIPTEIPSATPEPLSGMDSPTLCKLELAGLHNAAEKVNAAGMLTLNRYDIAKDICILDIKNMAAFGNLGQVEFIHKIPDCKYGISVKIDRTKEDQLLPWGKAALLFLNSKIGEEAADSAIRDVLAGNPVESELYRAEARDDVLIDGDSITPMRVIEIISMVPAAAN